DRLPPGGPAALRRRHRLAVRRLPGRPVGGAPAPAQGGGDRSAATGRGREAGRSHRRPAVEGAAAAGGAGGGDRAPARRPAAGRAVGGARPPPDGGAADAAGRPEEEGVGGVLHPPPGRGPGDLRPGGGDRPGPRRPRPAGRRRRLGQPPPGRRGRRAGRRRAERAAGRARRHRRGRGRLHREGPGRGRGHRRRGLRPGLEAPSAGPGPRRSRSGVPGRRGGHRAMTALRGTLRIARRELRAYLVAPWAYGMAVAFLLLTGTIFFVVADVSREASLRFWFPNLAFVLIVTAPIVTSRLVAEEWRSRHLDILLARPVGPAALVVGKWLAAVAFFVLLLAPTLVYCVFLAVWGRPDWPPLVASYLGAVLLVALFAAVGTMASALTPTAVAAGLGAFAVLVVLQLANNVPAFHGLSFQPHLESFARGAPGLKDAVYFVTGTAAALVVATAWQILRRRGAPARAVAGGGGARRGPRRGAGRQPRADPGRGPGRPHRQPPLHALQGVEGG